ncbi:serine/threonine-protein kinase Chk2 [Athalia rosae]|uniref:serine/threonine-protein kinase Chk2 n=1 Tax=Athalia rosae TaxID=37344 RepID=UPI00203328C0|nr:serine/threonine-protein kinase Chk2 [Athalia rosae]
MATDEQVLSLPDTQNADILTQTQSQSQSQETHSQNRIWGKLYPNCNGFNKVELVQNEYTFGRSERCDIVPTKDLTDRRLSVISKQHFRIIKEVLSNNLDEFVIYLEDTSHNGTFLNRVYIGQGKRVVLENNDTISLAKSDFSVYTFISTRAAEGSGLPMELKCKYAVSRTLGSGVCGEVKMLFTKMGCKKFALKTIAKSKFLTPEKGQAFNDPGKILNEVHILKALRHPCIIRMEEILDTPSCVYIVLELMEGGELFDRIQKYHGLPENIAKLIFYQVVLAVHYLHERGIAHRDLKPENILLASQAQMTLVKVSDFGLSKLVDTQTMMRTFCGTPMYVAPEVLLTHGKGCYTNQVDVWSLGVILYCCLSGLVPFSVNNKEIPLQHQIIQGRYYFPTAKFGSVSHRAIDLIRRMMTVDPKKRITISKVLLHNWLLDREMRSIVGKLMSDETNCDENAMPLTLPSTSSSNTMACNRKQMYPPTSAFKRARVE